MNDYSLEEKMERYHEASSIALELLNKNRQVPIPDIDFQIALGQKLGYKNPVESLNVIDHYLNAEEMINLLKNYAFNIPIVLYSFSLDENILIGNYPQTLEEKRIKVGGYIWQVHRNDADPFPSNPHAHSVDTSVKLHLGNGEVYQGRKNTERIKEKHLLIIRDKLEKVGIVVPNLSI